MNEGTDSMNITSLGCTVCRYILNYQLIFADVLINLGSCEDLFLQIYKYFVIFYLSGFKFSSTCCDFYQKYFEFILWRSLYCLKEVVVSEVLSLTSC